VIDIEKIKAATLTFMQSKNDDEEAFASYLTTLNVHVILKLIEKYKALEAKYERLKPRHEAYVKMLGELLAVLHADGGHYQYEHGTEKAVADAITKYYELVKQLDEYKRQSQNEAEIKQLEKIIHRQQFIEDRYEELMLSCRRCWRYYGADHELFTASMKAMDFLIRRHATEIDEMNEEDNDDRPDNLPSNA
jgi:hypothetical protein